MRLFSFITNLNISEPAKYASGVSKVENLKPDLKTITATRATTQALPVKIDDLTDVNEEPAKDDIFTKNYEITVTIDESFEEMLVDSITINE